jgi:hypothetical protein
MWVDMHTGLGGQGGYSMLTKNGDGIGSIGGGGDKRPHVWILEFASLLEGNGMGYGRSGNDGMSVVYNRTVGFLNSEVLCPLPCCMVI